MPLVNMRDMLNHAHGEGYAVGGFDVVGLEFVSGVMAAAEATRAPVILSLAESHFGHYDVDLLMAAVEAAARRATVPVAIHLDHGMSLETAVTAIRQGCNGVMVDASNAAFADNVARTRAVVDMAHGCGVAVEGELGYVAGVEGEDAALHPGAVVYTSVEEAGTFVDRTGVDCLAVSIGTVHGRMKGTPELDLDRLAAINDRLGLPLVIHGGTGLADDQYRALIARGVAKINYYTALADASAARIQANAADGATGHTALLAGSADAVAAETERMIRLWGGAGRADAVLAAARPWRNVGHVIVFNPEDRTPAEVEGAMAEGRRVLGAIPGVRRVRTGTALRDDARYPHCWLIDFAQAEVIPGYKNHPDHVRYADQVFRPMAADRITMDYQLDE